MKKRVCDAAVEILKETDNPAVMFGDEGLLHLIAERMGWPHRAWHTSNRVLRALSKTPGPLIKRKVRTYRYWVLSFKLPEP